MTELDIRQLARSALTLLIGCCGYLSANSAAAETINQLAVADNWQAAQHAVATGQSTPVNGSVTLSEAYSWLHIDLTAGTAAVIYLATPHLHSYEIISAVDGEVLATGGVLNANVQRSILHPEFMVELEPGWGTSLLLRVEHDVGSSIPVKLLTAMEERRTTAFRLISDGVYYGAIALMMLFALFVAIFHRSQHAARLSATLAVWMLTMFTATGYGNLLLWPGNPALGLSLYPVIVTLASQVSAWFCWHFLREPAQGSKVLVALEYCMWGSMVLLVLIPFSSFMASIAPLSILATGSCVLAACLLGAYRGDSASKYLLATTVLAVTPFAIVPWFPALQGFLFITGSLSLMFVVAAVVRRVADLAQAQAVKAEVIMERARFLASMSHEIRTPLNGVVGFTELCLQENPKGDLKQYIEQVSFSSKILHAVVEEVLDYSNLIAEGIILKPESMHLENTIANVITTVQANATAKHTELNSSIDSDIAEYVIADPRRFTQLLISLCSKAIKCTDHGSISIAARQDSSWLYIAVQDNGIGIDQETLMQMVAPFSKASESTARKFGGTGLGLAIGRQLAIMMHGGLTVESEIGKGSTYTLKIPYQEGEACVEVQQSQRFNLKGLSVLLAEDNPVNQLLATKILEKSGMRVDLAVDGQAAVDKAMRSSYDVILMDLQMPLLSGSEATEHIRRRGCNAPIIALTANTTESDREACFNAGMDDFLAKPVAQNVLLEKIGYWSSREGAASRLN